MLLSSERSVADETFGDWFLLLANGLCWIENIASYSIPVGSSWSGSVTVEDLSYDGYKDHDTWSGGLGMLTDGEYGLNSFNGSTSTHKGTYA